MEARDIEGVREAERTGSFGSIQGDETLGGSGSYVKMDAMVAKSVGQYAVLRSNSSSAYIYSFMCKRAMAVLGNHFEMLARRSDATRAEFKVTWPRAACLLFDIVRNNVVS